jgi:hypothetical protein
MAKRGAKYGNDNARGGTHSTGEGPFTRFVKNTTAAGGVLGAAGGALAANAGILTTTHSMALGGFGTVSAALPMSVGTGALLGSASGAAAGLGVGIAGAALGGAAYGAYKLGKHLTEDHHQKSLLSAHGNGDK